MGKNILVVLTSHDQLGETGHQTGFWLEELATPYYVFKDAGAVVTLRALPAARRERFRMLRMLCCGRTLAFTFAFPFALGLAFGLA